jgi:hypothetical protein
MSKTWIALVWTIKKHTFDTSKKKKFSFASIKEFQQQHLNRIVRKNQAFEEIHLRANYVSMADCFADDGT